MEFSRDPPIFLRTQVLSYVLCNRITLFLTRKIRFLKKTSLPDSRHMLFVFASRGLKFSLVWAVNQLNVAVVLKGEKSPDARPLQATVPLYAIPERIQRIIVPKLYSSHTPNHSQVRSMAQFNPQGRLIPHRKLFHVRPPLTLALELHVKVPQHACQDGAQFEIRQTTTDSLALDDWCETHLPQPEEPELTFSQYILSAPERKAGRRLCYHYGTSKVDGPSSARDQRCRGGQNWHCCERRTTGGHRRKSMGTSVRPIFDRLGTLGRSHIFGNIIPVYNGSSITYYPWQGGGKRRKAAQRLLQDGIEIR